MQSQNLQPLTVTRPHDTMMFNADGTLTDCGLAYCLLVEVHCLLHDLEGISWESIAAIYGMGPRKLRVRYAVGCVAFTDMSLPAVAAHTGWTQHGVPALNAAIRALFKGPRPNWANRRKFPSTSRADAGRDRFLIGLEKRVRASELSWESALVLVREAGHDSLSTVEGLRSACYRAQARVPSRYTDQPTSV